MKRITLFAKGNVDVHDSLHSCRVGGNLLWNGINEVLRQTNPGLTVRLRHETLTRFDALLAAEGVVPPELSARDLPLGTYPLASQFSQNVFTTSSDAVILSILPDVASRLVRHKRDGFLFYPAEASTWSAEDRDWLRSEFETTGSASVGETMQNLAAIVERIRQTRDVPILVYNLSPVIPGDFGIAIWGSTKPMRSASGVSIWLLLNCRRPSAYRCRSGCHCGASRRRHIETGCHASDRGGISAGREEVVRFSTISAYLMMRRRVYEGECSHQIEG